MLDGDLVRNQPYLDTRSNVRAENWELIEGRGREVNGYVVFSRAKVVLDKTGHVEETLIQEEEPDIGKIG